MKQYRAKWKVKKKKSLTMYTVPNPPCPSLFESENSFVADLIVARSIKGSSSEITNSPSRVSATAVGLANSCNDA